MRIKLVVQLVSSVLLVCLLLVVAARAGWNLP